MSKSRALTLKPDPQSKKQELEAKKRQTAAALFKKLMRRGMELVLERLAKTLNLKPKKDVADAVISCASTLLIFITLDFDVTASPEDRKKLALKGKPPAPKPNMSKNKDLTPELMPAVKKLPQSTPTPVGRILNPYNPRKLPSPY